MYYHGRLMEREEDLVYEVGVHGAYLRPLMLSLRRCPKPGIAELCFDGLPWSSDTSERRIVTLER